MDQVSLIRRCLIGKIATTFLPISEESGRLVNFSCAVDSLHPIDWLMAQSGPVKMYWSSRDVHLKVAGLGLADRVDSQSTRSPAQALGKIEKNLANASASIRYYGGLCFDMTDSTAAAWEGLGNYCFFVPEFVNSFDF